MSGVADVEVGERIGEILAGGPAVWHQGDSFSIHSGLVKVQDTWLYALPWGLAIGVGVNGMAWWRLSCGDGVGER